MLQPVWDFCSIDLDLDRPTESVCSPLASGACQ